jgi:ATP-dependent RNA helicase DeaD
VHRIGRTGRAGRSGVATLFITPRERRMMREIETFTGAPNQPMKLPTQADVAARRIGQLKDTIRKNIAEGDLDLYLQLVEQLAEEGSHDLAEIAAAAARLASTTRPITPEAPQRAAAAAPPASAPSQPRDSFASVRLSMAVGKRDGIRPADVVGSIANEADIPGRDIGPIDIRDDITYVSVPGEYVEQVLDKVGRAKFRGRPLDLKIATGGDDRPPRDRAPRRFEGPPQRKEWQPRSPRAPGENDRGAERPRFSRPGTGRPPAGRPGPGRPGPGRPGTRPDRGGPRKPPRKRY